MYQRCQEENQKMETPAMMEKINAFIILVGGVRRE